jgi:aminopeptidase N
MYFAGVYAQGAQALGGSGSEAGVRCALRRYVERNAYRIATPDDLLAALRAVYPDAGARFQQYGVG